MHIPVQNKPPTQATIDGMTLSTFPTLFIALYVSHLIGDHWLQTDHQATSKGHPGWPGRAACAAHVSTYIAAQATAIAVACLLLHLPVTAAGAATALTISAVSHYIADRRRPLQLLAYATGRSSLWQLGVPRPDRDDNPSLGTGAYALDQSWHIGWLFVAAVAAAA